jgi:chemotaxis protein MotC
MRPIAATLALATLLLASSYAMAADLATMIRDLNVMQNRMATGDAAARDQVAKQFDRIESSIDPTDAKAWSDERNTRAAITYLLSGGDSIKLRDVRDAKLAPESLRDLLSASLRYTDGDATELAPYDARQFPPLLGGHLALVQGGALIGKDNRRAAALLDLARLLMPASLIEEAAIRREIGIMNPTKDAEKLLLLTMRYLNKYLASPFARNFWDEFRLVAFSEANVSTATPRLDVILDRGAPEMRFEVYLTLARRAFLSGHLEWGADRLRKAEAAALDPIAKSRISAYKTVAAALMCDRDAAAIERLNFANLKPEDVEVMKLTAGVVTKLDAVNAPTESAHDASLEVEGAIPVTVKKALAESDALMERAARQ